MSVATLLPRRVALAAALALAAACGRPGDPAAGPAPLSREDDVAMQGVLLASAVEWNRGNLEGFVLPYDSAATFVGSRGLLRGKAAIRAQYADSYFGSGTPTGVLAFRDMEVRMLGENHALLVGRYVISDRGTGRETATGMFSLTMARRPEGWRIIHDHSS